MALFGSIGRFSSIVFCWGSNALDYCGVIAVGLLLYAILSKTSKIDANRENEDKQFESTYYVNTLETLPSVSYRRISLQVLLFFLLWLIPLSILLFFTIDTEFWKTLSFYLQSLRI
jgi:chromate transporter